MQTLTEDAADARHDTPYVPPEPCKMRVATPSLVCQQPTSRSLEDVARSKAHECVRPDVRHIGKTACMCKCGFAFDIHMRILDRG